MKWIITEQHDGMMIRDFLADFLHFSKRLIIRAKSTDGEILVNGERKTVRYILKFADVLEVKLPIQKNESIIRENIPLQIMYEDEDLLIVNKEAGMPTMPSRQHQTRTMANALLYYYERNNIPHTVHIVTRLDKDTSGLVLVAKHPYSHSLFSVMQRNQTIRRKYTAIVHGRLTKKRGIIDLPIGRKPNSIIERIVTKEGKKAITHYEVVQEFANYSVVNIELETGRTHQIRVHFSHLGHPLVGDDLYGGKTSKLERQALHCTEISFRHLFTENKLMFKSILPDDMSTFIEGNL